MKNEKMLERCLELVSMLNDDDRKAYDYFRKKKIAYPGNLAGSLAILISDLESDIASDCARSAGRSAALAAAKKVVAAGKKTCKSCVSGAWTVGERQYFCDGYRGFRLNKSLPLEPLDADATPLDLDRFFSTLSGNRRAINLPTIAELKAHIKTEKATRKAITKDKGPIGWDFGADFPLVDAEFLLSVLEILPDCKADCGGEFDPLYFVSDMGDAILLPRRRH